MIKESTKFQISVENKKCSFVQSGILQKTRKSICDLGAKVKSQKDGHSMDTTKNANGLFLYLNRHLCHARSHVASV